MEDITDADYAHAQRVCKSLEIKSLGEYHDLRVLKYMNLTRLVFLLQQELAWQAALKIMTKVKLYLLTDIDVINGRKRY